jgi:molecular chaperone GrpE
MKQKNSENTKKSNDSETEIFDIDHQIEEAAETENSLELDNEGSKKLDSPQVNTHKEALLELKELYKQLEDKETEYEKLYSRYLRALADYENLQKRIKEERARIIKNANENLLLKLLDLADTFEKAKTTITSRETNKVDLIQDGFQVVSNQFEFIIRNEGVERIKAVGEKFDPNYHEAVYVKPVPDVEEDTVLEEVQAGYLLNSSLLRPTKVVIAKKNTKGEK